MGSARSAPAEIREDAADVKLSVCREVLQVSNKYPTKAPCQPCDAVGRHTSKPQIEGYVDQRVHGDPRSANTLTPNRRRRRSGSLWMRPGRWWLSPAFGLNGTVFAEPRQIQSKV